MNDVVLAVTDKKPVWLRIGDVELTAEKHGLEAVVAKPKKIGLLGEEVYAVTVKLTADDWVRVDAETQAQQDEMLDDAREERVAEAVNAALVRHGIPDDLPLGTTKADLVREVIATVDRARVGRG